MREVVDNELKILQMVCHKNLVNIYEAFSSDARFIMILEYCPFISLENEMDKRKNENGIPIRPYTEKEIMVVFVQLCLATQ